jgi:hypothetical protein
VTNYKHAGASGYRLTTVVIGVVVIVVIAAALFLYPRGPTSDTVYCGILEYVIFPAQSIVGGQTINQTVTMTTAIDFTATTTRGVIGHTYSNSTTSTDSSGYGAGVETICKYISVISISNSSRSSSSSTSP